MEVSFYLTRTGKGTQTAIYAHIRYSGHRFKYYLTEKIDPSFWDAKEQRAKKTNRFPGYAEFNRRLDKIYSKIKDVHSAYRNDHDNREPSPDILRTQIDRHFKEEPKKGQKNFMEFFQGIVNTMNNGSRVQYSTGKPLAGTQLKHTSPHSIT